MQIKAKIYSCYSLTYSRIYQDVIKRIYKDIDINDITLEVEDISQDGILNIQSQRSLSSYTTRTIRIYEDNNLRHIVGVSNTNYDYDKNAEFLSGNSTKSKNSFGRDSYHANTYLLQGINNIINFYFENSCKDNVSLSFYLLDTKRTYPHNLYNILSYRELETIGFKILNLDMIDFSEYEKCCNSKLSYKNIAFHSFNKLTRDVAYISSRNKGNISSFLRCDETIQTDDNGENSFSIEKYIYTFKSLSAQGYDSLLRCWCMKVLADRENVDIEFRLGKQYFAYDQKEKKVSGDLTKPIRKTLQYAGINIDYITDETFIKETTTAEETFLRYKEKNELRNQTLFRNNIRKKGIPTECVLCGEDNVSILDAAHLWEVKSIKSATAKQINDFISTNAELNLIDVNSKYKNELFFKKYSLANSGDNGVWLCKNHHGLFDNNFFCFDSEDGKVILHFDDTKTATEFICSIKEDFKLPSAVFTPETKAFVVQRQLCFSA